MATREHLIDTLGCALLGCALLGSWSCVGVPRTSMPRVSGLADDGDDLYRASQRLVIEGLDADIGGQEARARSRYERALQVDASNPWAYLALARHYVDAGDAGNALPHLDRAEALLESQAFDSPGARVHCDGLRGAALVLQGREAEGLALLDGVARAAPGVWGDGHLDAAELR